MSLPKKEDITLPSYGTIPKNLQIENYTVKYIKVDMDQPTNVRQLEDIETRGLAGEEIVLITTDKFTFMEKYFIVLKYLEKKPE